MILRFPPPGIANPPPTEHSKLFGIQVVTLANLTFEAWPLGWRAPCCLTSPDLSPLKGDIPNKYSLHKVCIRGWLLRVPYEGYHHFPYDSWCCSASFIAGMEEIGSRFVAANFQLVQPRAFLYNSDSFPLCFLSDRKFRSKFFQFTLPSQSDWKHLPLQNLEAALARRLSKRQSQWILHSCFNKLLQHKPQAEQ